MQFFYVFSLVYKTWIFCKSHHKFARLHNFAIVIFENTVMTFDQFEPVRTIVNQFE